MANQRWREYIARSKERLRATQPKTVAEKLARIPIEQLSKMSEDELKKNLKKMEMGYKRRIQSFKKRGEVSYAQISLERAMVDKRPISELTRNQAYLRYSLYAKFFNELTSTSKGIQTVNLEQDIRIFGSDKRGRPLSRMTNDQRERYWSLYDEFINQNKADYVKYGSEYIQQTLASAIFGPEPISTRNLSLFLDAVAEKLKEDEKIYISGGAPNVYSGKGNTFGK